MIHVLLIHTDTYNNYERDASETYLQISVIDVIKIQYRDITHFLPINVLFFFLSSLIAFRT